MQLKTVRECFLKRRKLFGKHRVLRSFISIDQAHSGRVVAVKRCFDDRIQRGNSTSSGKQQERFIVFWAIGESSFWRENTQLVTYFEHLIGKRRKFSLRNFFNAHSKGFFVRSRTERVGSTDKVTIDFCLKGEVLTCDKRKVRPFRGRDSKIYSDSMLCDTVDLTNSQEKGSAHFF